LKLRYTVAAFLLLKQGIEQAVERSNGLGELEEEVGNLVRTCASQVLQGVLEGLDERLMAARDRSLEEEGLRSRRIVSTFGELTVWRRLYRDRNTGEWRFLLDEALGLEPRARVTPRLREVAVELGVEVPFRRAAEIIGKMMPNVSAMTVWEAVREAGEKARAEGKELRERVFGRGEDPGGTRKTDRLNIEADGMLVGVQRSRKKREEVKLGVAYEGKETTGERVELVERRVVAGVVKDEAFWEETAATLGGHWDLSEVKEVVIGADGASWAKAGVGYFDKAKYQLDEFHLRKAMREALGHDLGAYRAVSEALRSKDRERVMEALRQAEKRATGEVRQGIRDFELYVLGNWDGIKGSAESLGTIEGQVYHHLARRMKRQGARWTPDGADRMSRLLAAKANGELGKYLVTGDHGAKKPRPIPQAEAERVRDVDEEAEEIGAWLRARVPALTGPYQSRPFVKYVLRQIVMATGTDL